MVRLTYSLRAKSWRVTDATLRTARPLRDQGYDGGFGGLGGLQGAAAEQLVHGEAERPGERGDREEGGGGGAAGLDLAEGLGGDSGARRDGDHAALPARLAEQAAEPFAAEALFRGERGADHEATLLRFTILIPSLLYRFDRYSNGHGAHQDRHIHRSHA
ncbi:protein of unknown function [Streptomyces sp. KY75]|nr:protein of unknown function [Streptomyces sp. KY70]CAD5989974.1 protein of unknown function [Streptomyces sp. KY75]